MRTAEYHRVPSQGFAIGQETGIIDKGQSRSSTVHGLGIPKRKPVLASVPAGSASARAPASMLSPPPQEETSRPLSYTVGSPGLASSGIASPRTGLLSGSKPSPFLDRLRHTFGFTPAKFFASRKKPRREADQGQEVPMPSLGSETPAALSDVEDDAGYDSCSEDAFKTKFAEPPTYCSSKEDILKKRNSRLFVIILALSVYSTVLSAIWVIVSFVQPRWGYKIASRGGLAPSTATLITALVAKTIELSFVTVFIACVGQVLTRRAFARKSGGMTLAEMTMRNWVIQPGYLVTHFETIPYAGLTVLGALSLTASIVAMFYTTASEAMVAPKLKFGDWEDRELRGFVRSSYLNAAYVRQTCPSLIRTNEDSFATESCMNVQFSGQSYRSLQSFMTVWTAISNNGTSRTEVMSERPDGTALLYDNTTMTSTWIETEHSNVTAKNAEHGRIVNNVTLAMPHPGVYAAATNPINGILQPVDLAGVGEYSVRAGVVSPALNVMCVNMSPDELAPLIYSTWPNARLNETMGQTVVDPTWENDVPRWLNESGLPEYLNRTVVDGIFRWGPEYGRRPPIFQTAPADYNMVTNVSLWEGAEAFYILGKSPVTRPNYTLCEMRSWVSPWCSTRFDISGTAGASMRAHCEDAKDRNAYHWSVEKDPGWDGTYPGASTADWKWLSKQWGLSMYLNGGTTNENASNARILTQLALSEPSLRWHMPSMAEALAVYGSSMLVIGSIETPFRHYWQYKAPQNILGAPGALDPFQSSVITQQYTSGHVNDWQAVFYPVLFLLFLINLCCLLFLVLQKDQVTDFTEPQNFFALAINSPPSAQLKGSCGGGPQKRDLVVPWRVQYVSGSNHYFVEEASPRPWRGKYSRETATMERECGDAKGASYKRLSLGRRWF
ncbi:hypothetical protein RJ55_04811 [Drechmeria coniospora]|nr:hypothetical protein RJ55_04811 [Drechmeria coniospora]